MGRVITLLTLGLRASRPQVPYPVQNGPETIAMIYISNQNSTKALADRAKLAAESNLAAFIQVCMHMHACMRATYQLCGYLVTRWWQEQTGTGTLH